MNSIDAGFDKAEAAASCDKTLVGCFTVSEVLVLLAKPEIWYIPVVAASVSALLYLVNKNKALKIMTLKMMEEKRR